MKYDRLRSIAHNIADSVASGIGLAIGVYEMDIFREAAASPDAFIEVDFLNGTTKGGPVSASLATAISHYQDWLPALCEKHGASVSQFRELTARYTHGRRVGVTVEDQNGRRSTDYYHGGSPLKHMRVVDAQGRIRTYRKGKAGNKA